MPPVAPCPTGIDFFGTPIGLHAPEKRARAPRMPLDFSQPTILRRTYGVKQRGQGSRAAVKAVLPLAAHDLASLPVGVAGGKTTAPPPWLFSYRYPRSLEDPGRRSKEEKQPSSHGGFSPPATNDPAEIPVSAARSESSRATPLAAFPLATNNSAQILLLAHRGLAGVRHDG